jgi:hypothetical protein
MTFGKTTRQVFCNTAISIGAGFAFQVVDAFAKFESLLVEGLDFDTIVRNVFVCKSIKYIDFQLSFGFPQALLETVRSFRQPLAVDATANTSDTQKKKYESAPHRLEESRDLPQN